MNKETTPVEVCVENFLNCLKHFGENQGRDHYLETKTALSNFTRWLFSREVHRIGQVTGFVVSEFDLHLQDELAREQIDERTNSLIRDRVSDFLDYAVRSGYLSKNPNEGIL